METSFGGSSELLHDSVIPLLGLCPREMNIGVQKKKKKQNLRTFIAAVFLMVKQRKQYKSPTTDK